jgi:gamma-glutamyltranspeptidase/glutathione hydrolase
VGALRTKLLDPGYLAGRPPRIDRQRATPSSSIVPIDIQAKAPTESSETTHFSVVDRYGNAVACTTTLSAAFGAYVAVPETGVILSNAMGAFSPSGVNVLEPGKRMASSMTPALIVAEGKTVAALGSPGGDTIPGTVAQVVRNLIDHRMTLEQAVEAPRVHHQYQPDEVRVETNREPPAVVLAVLQRMGHVLKKSPAPLGDVNAILVDRHSGAIYGHADSRKGGLAKGPDRSERPGAQPGAGRE